MHGIPPWALLALAACVLAACGTSRPQPPAPTVSLPADDVLHPSAPVEWLYWTGHLATDTGRWFGFEEVFFNVGAASMAHVAVTDSDAGVFRFALPRQAAPLAASVRGFDLSLAGQTARGEGGHDLLHGEAGEYVFDLTLSPGADPVLQFGNGYRQFSVGGNSYYYSRERMTATGTVAVGGTVHAVHGEAWFDHQWGDLRTVARHGWDWFALQLDGAREVMIYRLRAADGTVAEVAGSFADGGVVRELTPGDVQVTATGSWTSPRTGCTYSSGWELRVSGLELTVTPALVDQEVADAGGGYWEGAALVSGGATGRAYVELTTCQ